MTKKFLPRPSDVTPLSRLVLYLLALYNRHPNLAEKVRHALEKGHSYEQN